MSRRTENPRGGGPKVSERLEAERIQESLEGERIQEAEFDGEDTVFREAGLTPEEMALSMKAESWAREVSGLVQALEGAAPTDREGR